MKKITKINIISNDSIRLNNTIQNIQEKEIEQHFDLKVGDVLTYNTKLHIFNEENITVTIAGVIEKIINYISDDYHSKTICLKVDDSMLSRLKWKLNYRRNQYRIMNATNTEVIEENPETGDITIQTIKNPNDIKFE